MSFHLTGGIFWLITQTVFAVVIDDIRLQHSPPGACNVWVYVCVCVSVSVFTPTPTKCVFGLCECDRIA